MSKWLVVSRSVLSDFIKTLLNNALQLIGCDHYDSLKLYHLANWHRIIKIYCPVCELNAIVKSYGMDDRLSDKEKKALFENEKYYLEKLNLTDKILGQCKIPRLFGVVNSPYFALVEEFVHDDDLCFSLKSAIYQSDDKKLRTAISLLSKHLADLHMISTKDPYSRGILPIRRSVLKVAIIIHRLFMVFSMI